jgi:TolA-binding protein
LAASGCHPYFNTFYNAEEAYQVAQRDHRKLMRVFPDSIVVTPSEGMAKQYDRAIEKSLKMMEVYPKDRKHQDRAHFLMGKASFFKKDFPVAVGRMRDLQTHYPQSPLVPESQVYVAKSHIMMDNLNIAEELLLALLREHPQLDRNQEITMLLVEIAMRRGGRSQALALLEGIRKNSSLPLEKRLDIILRMADLNYDLRQYQKALDLLRGAPRSKKHPYLMYRVDRSIYFCLDALDSLDPALAHVVAMQKNRAYYDQRYEIMYYRAVTLHRMNRSDEAIALLEEIRKVCGKAAGGKADAASLCSQASYELARIYLERGEYDKAALALEEAGKTPDSPVASKASIRLWALKRLKELRTPDSSGSVSAAARYSVAELFRFELETPDSAYYYYMELSADAAADSLRPRSLLAAAHVARYQLGNAARADSLLAAVVSEFDGTEYARRAQIEMDVEVTVVTEREMAEREFRSAEALLENDAVEGVKAFYNVYTDYPDMEIAPRSLHAAAWYTAGVLHKNRAAMTLYEELCEKYPESVYCKTGAASRLAVARDSIAVRRQRKEAAKPANSPAAGAPAAGAVDDSDGVDDGAGSGQ